MFHSNFALRLACAAGLGLPAAAWACSSCGCTLNSDFATQGFRTGTGWTLDLRYDYFKQDDLRSGTASVDRGAFTFPNDEEIQQETVNRNLIFTADYAIDADWGVNVQVPYVKRSHTTIAEGDTDASTSASSTLGDVRVIARYQGFSPEHDWGIQFGLKLATGPRDIDFHAGPQAGEPLDRGLQPGTGSTDVFLGIYRFGPLSQQFDYFVHALLQLPVTSRGGFKPGAGLNLSAGLRYVNDTPVQPQIQVNVRSERPESGANADVANSGATLAYVSPGALIVLTPQLNAYAFFQVPFYQRVTGLQIEPRWSVSAGVQYSF